jgi:CelD/BcsL family acetyltransferase involved in cellulose biosynthesis
MTIDLYTEFSQDLEYIWTKFENEAIMTPFQSYAWLSHWQHTVGNPLLLVQPQIVHLHTEGNTIAILPMGIRKMFGVRILEWLGSNQADYMGPLLIDNHDKIYHNENIWNLIKQNLYRFDVIHLRKQYKKTIQFLKYINLSSSNNKNLKAYKSSLPNKWDDYFGNIKKKLRSDSRRQYRRLAKNGDVKFIYAGSLGLKSDIIKSMIIQKRRRYQEKGVLDLLANKENQHFYLGLNKLHSDKFKIHCTSLTVGDISVATHVGFYDDTTFYYLMPANEGIDWMKYSPGRLLLIELLRWSIENKLKFFDFTIGGEAYKKDWTNLETELFDSFKTVSIIGKFYILALHINSIKKKISFIYNSWILDSIKPKEKYKKWKQIKL